MVVIVLDLQLKWSGGVKRRACTMARIGALGIRGIQLYCCDSINMLTWPDWTLGCQLEQAELVGLKATHVALIDSLLLSCYFVLSLAFAAPV